MDSAVTESGNSTAYQDEESMRRRAAANYVQSGHYQEAMNVLNSLGQKNGEWYYLAAMANMGLGNNVQPWSRSGGSPSGTEQHAVSYVASAYGRWRWLVSAATGSFWGHADGR